jgi:pimeloyl-ACP methyl ester carboxylesterase
VPTTTREGTPLYYETAGSNSGDGTVAFVGEAGYGVWQWGWQYDRVAGPFEALAWDLRGTGRSGSPPESYNVDAMADDLEAVLGAVEARRAHLVGAGLGGMVALRHARRHDRAASLALFNTARAGARVDERALGSLYAPVDDPDALRDSLSGAFSPAFLDQAGLVRQLCEWRADDDADRAAFERQQHATLAFEAGPLYELTLPALVCHGLSDPVVPADAGRELAEALPNGSFEAVAGRHLCFAEHSRAVNDRLLAFLDEHSG